jgi:hypothetical protein
VSVYDREPGTTSGRLRPSTFTPPSGSFVFVLGDTLGRSDLVSVDDTITVTQTADFGAAKLVRCRARVKPPAVAPAGARWVVEITIDGGARARRELEAKAAEFSVVDMTAHLMGLSAGDHELGFRLRLEAAP